MQFHEYGSIKTIPFMITLNGQGVNATLVAGDVKLSIDGAALVDVINLPVAVDATNAIGLFDWVPAPAETEASDYFTLYITDRDATTFDTNVVTHYTGGNANARFSG